MQRKEGLRVEWGRGIVGNCTRMSFLLSNPVLPDSGWARNTTKVFLEISKIFGKPSSSLSSLPLLHTWVLADDRRQKYVQGERV